MPSGPLFKSVSFKNGAAYISFDYSEGLHASDNNEIRTFELSGDDQIFYPAKAAVVNGELKVWSDKVKKRADNSALWLATVYSCQFGEWCRVAGFNVPFGCEITIGGSFVLPHWNDKKDVRYEKIANVNDDGMPPDDIRCRGI